ncbi:MAG TPA: hypothetical protein VGQ83_06160 [Polyangia bacterium]
MHDARVGATQPDRLPVSPSPCCPAWRGPPGRDRARRAPALLLGAALAVAGAAAPARAAPAPPPAAHLPAAFTVAVTPRALHADAATYRALLALWPGAPAALAAARAALGHDLTTAAGFARTGLSADGPLVVAAFAVERTEVEAAYRSAIGALGRRDWRGLRHLPPAFYHHRVVARVADPLRLAAFLAEQRLAPLTAATAPGVQRVVGVERKPAAELAERLRAAGAVGLARLPGDGLVLTRVVGRDLSVDIVQPWLAAAPPPADEAALLARLSRAPAAPAPAAAGARRLLAEDAAIAVHLDGARLQDLAEVGGRERALGQLLRLTPQARLKTLAAAEVDALVCHEGLTRAAAAATLTDAAAALRVHGRRLELHLAWTLAPGRAGVFAARDDRLTDLGAGAHGALGVLALRLDLGGFPARVPRDGPLTRRLGDATRFVASCGALTELLAMARYWPELLALALEEAHHERDAGGIVAGLHNLVVGLRDYAGDEPRLFALGSLEPAAARRLEALARAGRTPVKLGRAPLAGGRVLVMAATDAPTLTVAQTFGAARPAAARAAAVELEADLGRLLARRAATAPPAEAPGLRQLAARAGRLRGALTVEDDTLVGRLQLELR